MKTINDVVELSMPYLDAHKKMNLRFKSWEEGVANNIETTLNQIVNEITDKNDFFKSNLYVNVTSNDVFIKSGRIKVPFQDEPEEGFEVHFNIIQNGKVHVYSVGHSINKQFDYNTLEIIENPTDLTEEKIVNLVYLGIQKSMITSYLFTADE